jgi:hypothetical protein
MTDEDTIQLATEIHKNKLVETLYDALGSDNLVELIIALDTEIAIRSVVSTWDIHVDIIMRLLTPLAEEGLYAKIYDSESGETFEIGEPGTDLYPECPACEQSDYDVVSVDAEQGDLLIQKCKCNMCESMFDMYYDLRKIEVVEKS